jgi:3-oxoacyl-[acyl-carrier protein] reductase
MDLELRDKRALVTGSSRGLGFSTAFALAKEGCKVAVNSRDEARISAAAAKISAETGAHILGLAGDIGDPDVPERLVNEAGVV